MAQPLCLHSFKTFQMANDVVVTTFRIVVYPLKIGEMILNDHFVAKYLKSENITFLVLLLLGIVTIILK
jgi:hypothetical protein